VENGHNYFRAPKLKMTKISKLSIVDQSILCEDERR
jgi:hypothetical protein